MSAKTSNAVLDDWNAFEPTAPRAASSRGPFAETSGFARAVSPGKSLRVTRASTSVEIPASSDARLTMKPWIDVMLPMLGAVGVFLVTSALLEVVWQMRQPALGDASWRFNAIGVLAPNLLALAIASVLLTVVVVDRARPAVRVLWIAAHVFAALVLLALLPLFFLDVIQVRQGLPASMQGGYLLLAVAKIVVAYGGAALVCLGCAFSCRKSRLLALQQVASTPAWLA